MKRFLASALTAAMLFTGAEGLARRRAVGPPPYGPSHILPTMTALDDLVMTNHLQSDVPAKVCVDDVCDTYKLAAGETRTIPDLIQSKGKQNGFVVLKTSDNVEARSTSGDALYVSTAAPVNLLPGGLPRPSTQLLTYTTTPSSLYVDVINESGTRIGGKVITNPGGALLTNVTDIPGYGDNTYLKISGPPHLAAIRGERTFSATVAGLYAQPSQSITKSQASNYSPHFTDFLVILNPGLSSLQVNVTDLMGNTPSQGTVQPQGIITLKVPYSVHKIDGTSPSLIWRHGFPISAVADDTYDFSMNRENGYIAVVSDTAQTARITRYDAAGNVLSVSNRSVPANTRTSIGVKTALNSPEVRMTVRGNFYGIASANHDAGAGINFLPFPILRPKEP